MKSCLKSMPCILVLMLAWVGPVHSRTWNVNASGTGDAPTIQAAIDSAVAGDEVLVADGIYSWGTQGGQDTPSGLSMIVMRSNISLRSRNGPTTTILDAQSQGRVILCLATQDASIEGFAIQGGKSLDPTGTGGGLPAFGSGGGILLRLLGSVSIANCAIVDNFAQHAGGGIAIFDANPC